MTLSLPDPASISDLNVRGTGLMIAAPNGDNARVLVVDTDPETVAVVTYALALQGYEVSTAVSGAAAKRAVRSARPNLIVLGHVLSDMSGVDLVKHFRDSQPTSGIGLILLSAQCREADRIEGLAAGADDYIGKPFSPRELALRVAGVVRRLAHRSRNADPVVIGGPLTIDRLQPRVWVGDEEVLLTPIEHRLLSVFADSVGHIKSRDELLDMVWGLEPGRQTRTVDVHVRRLRAKLGVAGRLIESVRGLGYRLVPG